jgi:tetratricopeptide (TPR) repeat protein
MMHKKALLYDKQGCYDLAIDAYKQARHQSIQIYGEEDLSTVEIHNNYAITRRKQGYYDKALEIFQRIFRIHGHVQGRNHPLTLNVQGNIAIIDGIRGQPDALHAHEWVLELKKKWLGPESASTLSTLSAYALLLSKLKHHQVAIRVAQQALEGYQKVLGESDPATLGAIANCALIYEEMGTWKMLSNTITMPAWAKQSFSALNTHPRSKPSPISPQCSFGCGAMRKQLPYRIRCGEDTHVFTDQPICSRRMRNMSDGRLRGLHNKGRRARALQGQIER